LNLFCPAREASLSRAESLLGAIMSGKLNWDRVKKENLARAHGSERIDDLPIPRSLLTMPNCTCKKPIGFTGAHKKDCPLSRRESGSVRHRFVPSLRSPSAVRVTMVTKVDSEVTLRQFASAMKGIRQRKPIRKLLSELLKMLPHDETTTTQQKKDGERAISAMLKALSEQTDQRGSTAVVKTRDTLTHAALK
jgi:hypothetical protein